MPLLLGVGAAPLEHGFQNDYIKRMLVLHSFVWYMLLATRLECIMGFIGSKVG
jgi:hypothetical protein